MSDISDIVESLTKRIETLELLLQANAKYLGSNISKLKLTTGNITTASVVFIDAAGVTLTLATGANRALMFLSGTWNAPANLFMDFTVDGVRQGAGANGLGYFNAHNYNCALSYSYLSDVLTAGSHTFKMQWMVDAGTGTIQATATVPLYFTAIEIKP